VPDQRPLPAEGLDLVVHEARFERARDWSWKGGGVLQSVGSGRAPLLGESRGNDAYAVAAEIANRLADPGSLRRASGGAPQRTTALAAGAYEGRGLASGSAGLALLFGAFASVDERWHAASDAHLRAAAADDPLGSGPSLFNGTAGLLEAARVASRGRHYSRLIERLQAVTDAVAVAVAGRLANGVDRDAEYDLISGASGVLVATRDRAARAQLAQSIAALARAPGGAGWTARSRFGDSEMTGNNLGLGHGASGMIASLAACADVDGVPDAVSALVAYVLEHCETAGGAFVDVSHFVSADGRLRRGRAAWCYGAPGTAVALLAAAAAFAMPQAARCARELLERVAEQDDDDLGIHDDAICHGRAGIALVLGIAGEALQSTALCSRGAAMLADVIDRFDPSAAFGYRSAVAGGEYADDPFLLTGAAGIALALLVACGRADTACLAPLHLDARRLVPGARA
jgi:lantibiotic modifying enzyme